MSATRRGQAFARTPPNHPILQPAEQSQVAAFALEILHFESPKDLTVRHALPGHDEAPFEGEKSRESQHAGQSHAQTIARREADQNQWQNAPSQNRLLPKTNCGRGRG